METKVNLTKEMINSIFGSAKSANDYIVELYKVAIPEFDQVKSIKGYPKVSKTTNMELFRKAIETDERNESNCMTGGAWMNWGFSSNDSENIPDWIIDNSEVELVF